MATLTKQPNANGTLNENTPTGAANAWDCVDEATTDEDTTHLASLGGGVATATDRFDFDWSAIGDLDTITQIDVVYRARVNTGDVGTDKIRAVMFTGSITWNGTIQTMTTSYGDFTHVYTVGLPADGADLKANYQFGIQFNSNNLQADEVRCTRIEVTVTYTPNVAVPEDANVPLYVPHRVTQVVAY